MLKRVWIVVSTLWSLIIIYAEISAWQYSKGSTVYTFLGTVPNGPYHFRWDNLFVIAFPWLFGPLVLWIVRFIFLGSPAAKLPVRDIRFRRTGE